MIPVKVPQLPRAIDKQAEYANTRQREGLKFGEVLTPEPVAELRQKATTGKQEAELAHDFGISRETLYQYLRTGD